VGEEDIGGTGDRGHAWVVGVEGTTGARGVVLLGHGRRSQQPAWRGRGPITRATSLAVEARMS
jgi:hypothetical protein